MTHSSSLWNMKLGRLMVPIEKLAVQGINVFSDQRKEQDRYAVEIMALSGQLSSREVSHLMGNSMNLQAVGSVFIFSIASSIMSNHVVVQPALTVGQESNDNREHDDSENVAVAPCGSTDDSYTFWSDTCRKRPRSP